MPYLLALDFITIDYFLFGQALTVIIIKKQKVFLPPKKIGLRPRTW